MRPVPIVTAAISAILLGGCGLQLHPFGDPILPKERAEADATPPLWDAEAAKAEDGAVSAEDQAQAYADHVNQSMHAGQTEHTSLFGPEDAPPDIQWINPGAQPQAPAQPPALAANTNDPPSADAPVVEQTQQAPPSPAPAPSRDELLAQLHDDLRRSSDPALKKALTAAALSAADPSRELDERFLAPLAPRQREAVEQYHRLLVAMHDRLAVGATPLDRESLSQQIDTLLGNAPVTIDRVELCRRVSGYGVYEPFDHRRFLAGRDHKMIVYIEVDHFASVETRADHYEVKLRQEVELYDDDGLLVWRHEPVEILDRSRNQREDFFTVQLIQLPARLTVGRFHLKVRVRDEHGRSRAEQTVGMEIVADQSLAVK